MKTILATTDFSRESINAVNYAAEMAVAIKAQLHIVHIFQNPVVYSEVPVSYGLKDLLRQAELELMRVKERASLKVQGNVHMSTEMRQGAFFSELNMVCDQVKPYAVVMGSQGKSAAERILFGGHTLYALQHLNWPLVVVPGSAVFSAIKKIALACDFNHIVERIPITEIKTLVNDFKAELYIINIGRKEEFDPEIVFESGLLEEKLAPLKPHLAFGTNDNADEGIIEFIEKNDIGLLILFPRQHNLIERLIHKGHTKNLVLHSRVPVLAFHS